MSNLLIEVTSSPVTILSEGKDGDGRMKIRATLLRMDEKNLNNRTYPSALMVPQIAKMQERIAKGPVVGAADHPRDGANTFDTVALAWTRIWHEGPAVFGEATVFNNERGRTLQEVLRVCKNVPVSIRGFGTTQPGTWKGEPCDIVQMGYSLETADVVLNAQGFPDAIAVLREQRQRLGDGDGWTPWQLRQRLAAGIVNEETRCRCVPSPNAVGRRLSWSEYRQRTLARLSSEPDELPEGEPPRRMPPASRAVIEETRRRQRLLACYPHAPDPIDEVAARAPVPLVLTEAQRAMRKLAGVPLGEELSFNDIEDAARRAVAKKYGPGGDVPTLAHATGEAPYVVAVLSKKVIVRWNSKLWAIGYEMEDVGDAVLKGVPEQTTIQYLPVKSGAAAEERGEPDLPEMTEDQRRQRFLLGEHLLQTVSPPEEAAPPAVSEAARRAVMQSLGRGDLAHLNSPVVGATVAHMDGATVTVACEGISWRVAYSVTEDGIRLQKPVAASPRGGVAKRRGLRPDVQALKQKLGV